MNWFDWLILGAVFIGYGWAGQDEYEYRCNQAHIVYSAETCPLDGDKP